MSKFVLIGPRPVYVAVFGATYSLIYVVAETNGNGVTYTRTNKQKRTNRINKHRSRGLYILPSQIYMF